jgi:hypothetical protein
MCQLAAVSGTQGMREALIYSAEMLGKWRLPCTHATVIQRARSVIVTVMHAQQ